MPQFYDELIDETQVYYMLPNLGTSEAADAIIGAPKQLALCGSSPELRFSRFGSMQPESLFLSALSALCRRS
jgi:hypothetical protein